MAAYVADHGLSYVGSGPLNGVIYYINNPSYFSNYNPTQMIQDYVDNSTHEIYSFITNNAGETHAIVVSPLGAMTNDILIGSNTSSGAGGNIRTQDAAQKALVAVDKAIVSKDKIRASLGALQNRLENTVSNLQAQAENLQSAESRISDVDVASEMTRFVREQILTQSSVAMLSQANSMPKMAMQIIGG